jgi:hypothetical protein
LAIKKKSKFNIYYLKSILKHPSILLSTNENIEYIHILFQNLKNFRAHFSLIKNKIKSSDNGTFEVGLRGVALGSAPLRSLVIQENNFQNEICPKADSDRSAIFKIIAAFTFYQKVASSFIQEDNSNQESVEKMISVKLEFAKMIMLGTEILLIFFCSLGYQVSIFGGYFSLGKKTTQAILRKWNACSLLYAFPFFAMPPEFLWSATPSLNTL